jgi:hypothetical protein
MKPNDKKFSRAPQTALGADREKIKQEGGQKVG